MIPERIVMSKGGEKLESVVGRGEDEELPSFEDGAFEIEVGDRSRVGKKLVDEGFLNKYVQEGAIGRHTMRGLIDSIRLVDPSEFICSEVSLYHFLEYGLCCLSLKFVLLELDLLLLPFSVSFLLNSLNLSSYWTCWEGNCNQWI